MIRKQCKFMKAKVTQWIKLTFTTHPCLINGATECCHSNDGQAEPNHMREKLLLMTKRRP